MVQRLRFYSIKERKMFESFIQNAENPNPELEEKILD